MHLPPTENRDAMAGTPRQHLCRDCLRLFPGPAAPPDQGPRHDPGRCPSCASPRLIAHDELELLAIAHVDCDAFYASVEKRDRPELRDQPVIVGGGGARGVVAAACYIARASGIHSAMPMFQARRACPQAVVVPPDMAKYAAAAKSVRALMNELTPLVEPISIDEAFLDLSGTGRLHRRAPAQSLAAFAQKVESEVGITVSVGLSYNKFLAKIASDLDKPRGFAVIGRHDAARFLADRPVGLIWGVGAVLQRRLAADGITRIGQLQHMDAKILAERYGAMGARLHHLARGEDNRAVDPRHETKSISAETTFESDILSPGELERRLWLLAEKVSGRIKAAGLSGACVTLKLKTTDFQTITRSVSIPATALARSIFAAGQPLLAREANGRAFRLIGIGLSRLEPAGEAAQGDLLGAGDRKLERAEAAMDDIRARFGKSAVIRGRALKQPDSGNRGK